MTDLVQQLHDLYSSHPVVMQAADEIARLRTLSQNNAHSWDAIVRERNALREKVKKLELELVELDER